MVNDEDYEVDEKKRTISVLEGGITKVEDYLGIDNLYDSVNTPLISFMNNAIKAKELFRRDKEYVVLDGEVLIVDEHTGRMLHGRRYNEGLHQAIEAKEGVQVREEYQTLATITLQNYFRLYEKLSGMTGTAMTEASEFDKIYKLGVVPIPTNRPMARVDQPDLVYRTEEAKYDAVVEDIAERHRKGQPVLVGTVSVEKSEYLSQAAAQQGRPALGPQRQAARRRGEDRRAWPVTRAPSRWRPTWPVEAPTSCSAARSTSWPTWSCASRVSTRSRTPRSTTPPGRRWSSGSRRRSRPSTTRSATSAASTSWAPSATSPAASTTSSAAARAVRATPASRASTCPSQDELMRLFKSDWVDWVLTTLKVPDDVPIENKRVTNSIASAQSQVEAQNFDSRKNVLKYDDVMSRQREVIYAERRAVLEGADLHEQVRDMIDQTVAGYVDAATQGFPEEWDLEKLWTALRTLYPVSLKLGGARGRGRWPSRVSTATSMVERLQADAQAAYDAREAEFGDEVMRELERRVVLSVLDRKWREHLYEMDYLREGIGLRAYSQRDPLVEYQREGFDMFNVMMDAIREESVAFLFNLDVQVEEEPDEDEAPAVEPEGAVEVGEPVPAAVRRRPAEEHHAPAIRAKGLDRPAAPSGLTYTAPDGAG